jgi:hypothetical protein
MLGDNRRMLSSDPINKGELMGIVLTSIEVLVAVIFINRIPGLGLRNFWEDETLAVRK